MKSNISYNAGSLILIKRVDDRYKFFDFLFKDLTGKTKHLMESAKALINNRLDKCVSVNQIVRIYPRELFESLGFREPPKQRTLYRDLERIGKCCPVIVDKYQKLIKNNNLVSEEQFPDFSSSYFEGNKAELGALGYSREHRPGKKQITFGISTGMNEIPTALTIQKGNVQDKKHMKSMINLLGKICDKGSVLIVDCGGNTKKNKQHIKNFNLNYLTLLPKNKNVYKKFIEKYKKSLKEITIVNGIRYKCVKFTDGDEIKYVFHSKRLFKNLKRIRNKKFRKELIKNKKVVRKIKRGKELNRLISEEGHLVIRGEIEKAEIKNPYITGIEGFFILESSVDDKSGKILTLYKQRDKSEKLIRNMKEGTELRPINHFSKDTIIGYLLIVFLANCVISLTHIPGRNSVGKNVKLLKKYLNNVTVTVVYDESVFKFSILSNITPEIRDFLGDSIEKFREKPPNWI